MKTMSAWLAVCATILACGTRVSVGDLGPAAEPGSTGAGGSAGSAAPIDSGAPAVPDGSTNQLGGAACGGIEYPVSGFYGDNFLHSTYVTVNQAAPVSMVAKLNVGASLRIKMTLRSGTPWLIHPLTSEWRASLYDFAANSQLFEAPDTGRSDEMRFEFPEQGEALVEYFECGSSTPTGSKVLSWGGGSTIPHYDGGSY